MPLVSHLQGLWGRWWFLPAAPLLLLPFFAATGNLRPEHVIIVLIIVAGAAINRWTRDILVASLPGMVILLGYELIRYIRPIFVTPDRVLGCGMRDLEQRLFAFGGVPPSQFFADHHNAFFDIFFALPYTFFWAIAVGYTIFLYFRNRVQMQHYLWVLALTHAAAFVIWMALPTAPPWYVLQNGCAIDINALPSPAALMRLDHLFGITYYEGFYSRDPTVFGALPSLHCTFPTAGLLAVWRAARWPQRLVHLGYVLWMLTASVYLGHHWLLDGLLGIAIAVAADMVVVRFLPRPERHAAAPAGAQN